MRQLNFLLVFVLMTSICSIERIQAGVVILNGLSHEFTSELGTTVKGEIVLQNPDDQPQDVKLFKRDYTFNAEGASFFPDNGTIDRSNGTWIEVGMTFVTLQPQEEMVVNYEVTIPNEVPFDGTYWSVIIVEGTGPIEQNPAARGLTVNTIIRYAVQVITHIGDSGIRELQFNDYTVVRDSVQNALYVIVENTGERLLVPDFRLELYDNDGNETAKIEAGKKKLYPNTSPNFRGAPYLYFERLLPSPNFGGL